MALRARLSGISCNFEPDEIECLVRTAAEALHGQSDDLSQRQRELAAQAYKHLQDEMRMHDPEAAAARQAVIASAARTFAASEDLRGAMVDGYSAGDIERILGPIGQQTGLHLICIWQRYIECTDSFVGDSNLYIEADGQIFELGGDLWGWLNLNPADPDTPATPGDPASWVGSLCAEMTMNDIEWTDADDHNYAVYVE